MSETLEYKCPNCGGAINFDPSVQEMKCSYCDSKLSLEALKQYSELSGNISQEKIDWKFQGQDLNKEELESLKAYSCESCGGEIIAQVTTAATSCPYCGNPAVINSQLSGMLRPDLIIPFKLDKTVIAQAFKSFLKGKFLLPGDFKRKYKLENIKGIYAPFWLFDCASHTDACFNGTKVLRRWSDRNYDYVETGHYKLLRSGDAAFEKIPVDGSTKMPDEYMEAIEPYNYSELTDFKMPYLSGFLADKYDVGVEKSEKRANERIGNSMITLLKNTTSGYSVTLETSNIQLAHGDVKYAMMPVYMLNTKYKNKIYTFAMNGQTGKFIGNLPVSWGKFFAWFASVSTAVFVLLTLLGM